MYNYSSPAAWLFDFFSTHLIIRMSIFCLLLLWKAVIHRFNRLHKQEAHCDSHSDSSHVKTGHSIQIFSVPQEKSTHFNFLIFCEDFALLFALHFFLLFLSFYQVLSSGFMFFLQSQSHQVHVIDYPQLSSFILMTFTAFKCLVLWLSVLPPFF